MSNLTKEQFKNYYNVYFKDIDLDEDEIRDEIFKWKYYRDKIINGTLEGREYNSTKGENEEDVPPCLRQFLERGSNTLASFGSMVAGKLYLWITRNEKDEEVWYRRVRPFTEGNKEEGLLTNDADKKKYLAYLLDYLKKMLTTPNLDTLMKTFYDDIDKNLAYHFASRGFLEKMIIFNSFLNETQIAESRGKIPFDYHHKLVFIYTFGEIERIDLFKDLQAIPYNLEKNKKLTEICLDALGIANPTIFDLVRIQRCVWSLRSNEDTETLTSDAQKNVIFYGAPGTGKTYQVTKALASLGVTPTIVQFHPGFTYEDFIEGIKPTGLDASGNLKFEVVNGIFKDFCIKAKNDPDNEYYFIVDEINRADLSNVFGETLSLLEEDYRFDVKKPDDPKCLRATPLSRIIQKQFEDAKKSGDKDKIKTAESLIFYKNSKGEVMFGVPKNVHFIGMMNDVDKSIDSFDLALRRRFVWVHKEFDEKVVYHELLSKGVKPENIVPYVVSCVKLNYYITGYISEESRNKDAKNGMDTLGLGRAYEIGHSIFMRISSEDITSSGKIKPVASKTLWEERLEPTIREYLRSTQNESAIDGCLNKAKEIFCPSTKKSDKNE